MGASRRLNFENRAGISLSAVLELPDGEALAYALFAHCFTCSKNLKALHHISAALCAQGIGVMRFDFTGLGESQGDFADTSFTSNVSDLVDAAAFMTDREMAPAILVGHSLGGAAVLKAAAEIPSTRAVATIGAPAEPSHVAGLLAPGVEEIRATGSAEVKIAGRSFRIGKRFLDDIEEQSLRAAVRGMRLPLLVFHSPVDDVVGIDNAQRIFEAARHPKSFVSLDDADHLLLNPVDSRYVAHVLSAWASRFIASAKKTVQPVAGLIASLESSGFRVTMQTGRHSLVADEPEEYGGGDTGPAPYDFLIAALASCTAMTLRMYADRKKWPLETVDLTLSHAKIHAKDCEDCETEAGSVDRIERVVRLSGDLDRAQRDRLLEIADMCPVHRTLHNEVSVVTTEG